MSLRARRVADQYILAALNGILGILHNRFSYIWDPALECLTFLVGQYFGIVWNKYIDYLEHCQSEFLASHHQHNGSDNASTDDTGSFLDNILFAMSLPPFFYLLFYGTAFCATYFIPYLF